MFNIYIYIYRLGYIPIYIQVGAYDLWNRVVVNPDCTVEWCHLEYLYPYRRMLFLLRW